MQRSVKPTMESGLVSEGTANPTENIWLPDIWIFLQFRSTSRESRLLAKLNTASRFTHLHDIGIDVIGYVVSLPDLGDPILLLIFVHQIPVFWKRNDRYHQHLLSTETRRHPECGRETAAYSVDLERSRLPSPSPDLSPENVSQKSIRMLSCLSEICPNVGNSFTWMRLTTRHYQFAFGCVHFHRSLARHGSLWDERRPLLVSKEENKQYEASAQMQTNEALL